MSASFGFKVAGFAEIEAALNEIRSVRTRKAALKRGMMAAAQPMAEAARGMAPVSVKATRKKHLRDTIGVGDKLTRRQAAIARAEGQDGDITIYVGAGGTPAAVQQEFGNVNHGPHPFMRPAWDQDHRAMLARLADMVRDEVFKSLSRQRKRG